MQLCSLKWGDRANMFMWSEPGQCPRKGVIVTLENDFGANILDNKVIYLQAWRQMHEKQRCDRKISAETC